MQALTSIADHFDTSRRIRNLVNRQRARAREWVDQREQIAKEDRNSSSRDIAVQGSTAEAPVGSRSIFDDIAE